MTAAFVQTVVAGGTAVNATSLVLTLSGITTVVGRHLVLSVSARTGSPVTVTVTDSKGNTWATDILSTATGILVAIASCKIASALVNGDTITITLGGGVANTGIAASVAEYSGLAAASWLDKTAGVGSTTGTASDSGATATTAQADELLIGATSHQSTVTSFAAEVLSPVWNLNTTAASLLTVQTIRPMYRVVAATGAYSAKATWTTSRVWAAAIATYKAVAGSSRSSAVIV